MDNLGREGGLGSVLILEDEGLVSLLIEDIVREMGAERVQVFAEAKAAREAAESSELDFAILDLHLPDGDSAAVADALESRGVPFIFSSGSGSEWLQERHRNRPMITKPFSDDSLRALIRDVVADQANLQAAE